MQLIFIISIFFFILAIYVNSYNKPRKFIVDKYGVPLNHFATQKGWNSLPVKGSRIDVHFYSDFIIIAENNREIVLNKDFKEYDIYGSFLNYVFEINNLQICINMQQRDLLEKFFNN